MADDKDSLSQDELDHLLGQQSAKQSPSESAAQGSPQAPPAGALSQNEIEALLAQGAGASEGGSTPAARVSASEGGDAGKPSNPEDIGQLLGQAGGTSPPPAKGKARETSPGDHDVVAPGDVEYLFSQAQRALESLDAESVPPPDLAPFPLDELKGEPASTEMATLDLISDVQLDLKIELGRTNMYLEDVLKLRRGSVVPLDKLAGDPVDIYVNDRLIARGEVLVLNDNFCVRVGELIAGTDASG